MRQTSFPIRHFLPAALAGFLAGVPVLADAQDRPARIAGKVLDAANAIALPGVPVEVVDTGQVAHTDLDGMYAVAVPPGAHEVKVAYSGYAGRSVRVEVAAGETRRLDLPLSVEKIKLSEEVTVTAEGAPAHTQSAALLEREKAGAISEALAREEMGKNADSDAAQAMQRVTGVSVVDGQYVFVRGLGERYSNTTLNGALLPTTEPDKRVVPLDLFPTGLLESVRITKSYLPDKPAEFAGGLLEIEPVNFPSGRTFNVSLSVGGNTQSTFQDLQNYDGGGLDWAGFDSGARAIPSSIPAAKLVERGVFGTGFDRADLVGFGRAFDNVWEPRAATGGPDSSFSVLAGNSWDRLGAVASLSYNYKTRYREEQQNIYVLGSGGGLRRTNNFDFRYSTYRATVGGVVNLAYRFSGNHRLALENFFTNSGRDEVRTFEGFQEDKGVPLRNARLFWIEESVLSSKLSGDHLFPGLSNSRLEWRGTFSRAARDEPDLRETLYQFNPAIGSFELANESQSGLRMFNTLDDYAYQGDADWTVLTPFLGRHGLVKAGGSVLYRQRDFSSRRFRLKPTRSRLIDLTQAPEDLFVPEAIGLDFQIEEDTRRTDTYDAEQTVLAGYAMADLPLSERLRFIGGARMESSDQTVITRDLFDPTLPRIRSGLDNVDILPGLNLVFQLREAMNLRAAYSQTVNRPEFRELAPFEFTDIVGGRAVVGNPNLERALIRNADLRWEWFPRAGSGDAEVLAVSVFFKDFERPIERVVEATAAFRTSYANARGARNYGVEVEARKALGPHVLTGINYTLVESKIELDRGAGQIQTSLDRPLAGQSRNVLNGMLEWKTAKGDFSARALVNWFDDRISDVGALGIPDILEKGRVTVDAVVTRRFGSVSLRLNGENLTDAEERYEQGGEPQRLFRTGRSLSLGLSYTR